MTRTRWLVVGVAAAAFCVAGTGGGLALAGSGPTQLEPAYVVQDASSAETLSVQLQLGVRDTGAFDFSVDGVGEWLGVIPIGPVSGPIVHLKGSVTAQFEATGSSAPGPATVRMEGQIDQSHSSATVNVWVTQPGVSGQTHYNLHTANPDDSQASSVAQTALTALVAQDWATIYGIADKEITSQFTEAQFAAAASAGGSPTVGSATFTGPGTTTIVSGVTYFYEPIRFTAVGGGTYTANLTLVWEQGQWLFAGTSTPQPSS